MNEETRQQLAATVTKLQETIQQIRKEKVSIGEEATKTALINPLLATLGWDVGDIHEVRMEYKRTPKDKPVDYALCDRLSGFLCLFVEAKALDIILDDRKWIIQTVNYANVVGVKWCVLTNGDEYRLYNAHAEEAVEDKLFRSVRISDSGQDRRLLDTLSLLSKEEMKEKSIDVYWKSEVVDRKVTAAMDDLFGNEDKGLLRLLKKRTSGLRPADIRSSLQRASIKVEFPISTPPPPVKHGDKGVKIHRPHAEDKGAAIVEMLRRKDGATIAELVEFTGWKGNSVRGFLSGTIGKKMRLKLQSTKRADGQRVYRIAQ